LPLAGRAPSGAADVCDVSWPCGGAAAGTGRAFISEPGGPVTGVVAPAAAVGNALSEATDEGGPEEEEGMPAPGEIGLDGLSSVPLALVPPSSISLSSDTTCFALP